MTTGDAQPQQPERVDEPADDDQQSDADEDVRPDQKLSVRSGSRDGRGPIVCSYGERSPNGMFRLVRSLA